jgi:DNA-binding SARP family transcriptional activator
VVSVERLIDRLWGDEPPRTPLGTLQSYVSRLRRAVEPVRGSGVAPQVLVSEAPGYVLRVPAEQVDVHRFRHLVAEARAALAAGRPGAALAQFDEAAALWRGPALAGVGPEEQIRPLVVQLEEERDAAVEDRFETLLALGRHAEAVPLLQAAVDERPLRERRWALLALALYRSSRQADALRALASARATLLEDLGLDPGPELRTLEQQILAQDPNLALAPTPEPAGPAVIAATPAAGPGTRIVGREAEWAALETALEAARSHGTQLVLVEGEPGIGKSTLCEAFLAHAAEVGWRTATGRCVEPGLAPSLWPCLEIVRSIVGEPDPDGAGPAAAGVNDLHRLVNRRDEVGPTLAPVEMADQFIQLLDALAGPPWVFLLDDLHWGDHATLDVVRLVLERTGNRPILLLAAHRPLQLVPDSLLGDALGAYRRAAPATTRLVMSPLSAPDVAELIELTTGVAPSSEVAARVAARAGGNALFVTELARLVGERGVRDTTSVVPDAIRDVVRSRLAQLPERATAELEVAAVLGERFDLRTAMAASERGPDDCLDALDAAIVTRILVPDGDGFRFAHALVRDAVLADVSPLRLARLHHRAADAIVAVHGDGPDEAEPVAHHRLAARSFADPVGVAKAAVRAADVARWRGALDAADDWAEQALEALSGTSRTAASAAVEVEALESIVSAATRRDDPDAIARAAARAQHVADSTGSESARALALFLRWGDIDGAEDIRALPGMDEAHRLAGSATESYAIVTTRYMLASYAFLTGALDEAAEHLEVAAVASGAVGPDDRPDHVPLVQLPVIAGLTAATRGDADLAREQADRRAPAWLAQRSEVDPTANVTLAFNRAFVRALLGEPASALTELRSIVRPTEDAFVRHELVVCDLLAGWARVRTGDPTGLELAFDALARLDAGTDRVLRSCLRTFVADACLALDDDRAADLLATAAAEAESRGERWWLAETRRLQAELARRSGDAGQAEAALDEAEAVARGQGAGLVLTRIASARTALAG